LYRIINTAVRVRSTVLDTQTVRGPHRKN